MRWWRFLPFLYELVFLTALTQAARPAKLPAVTRSLSRRTDTAGHVDEELLWGALSATKRIGQLKNDWQKAEKTFRTEGEAAYAKHAVPIYAHLRQTWERAVEEVLLEGVVERFRPSVETARMRHLSDIQASDLETVTAGMTKSSKWEGGHDHALAVNEPVPTPTELQADIKQVEDFIAALDARRRAKKPQA